MQILNTISQILLAIFKAPAPLIRTMPIPPIPEAVAIAAMVSPFMFHEFCSIFRVMYHCWEIDRTLFDTQ